MNAYAGVDQSGTRVSTRVLVTSDLLAFVLFVIAGRMLHNAGGPVDWLMNVPRIASPFLLGWVAGAVVFGAYPRAGRIGFRRFATNSILALLVGDLIAIAIRAFIVGDGVNLFFVITAISFTTLFVISPRLLYFWAMTARSAGKVQA